MNLMSNKLEHALCLYPILRSVLRYQIIVLLCKLHIDTKFDLAKITKKITKFYYIVRLQVI